MLIYTILIKNMLPKDRKWKGDKPGRGKRSVKVEGERARVLGREYDQSTLYSRRKWSKSYVHKLNM